MGGADGIVRLEPSQLRRAGEVLSRAFHDDPFYVTLLPEEGSRPKRLAWFMERMLRYGLLRGHVYTTPEVEGVACWFPPGLGQPSGIDILLSGLFALPLRLGVGPYRRLTAFTGYADPIRHRNAPDAHWYLVFLGVDRPGRGRGLGGRLLQPVLRRADEEKLACYLETENQGNLPFYARHGFALAEAGREPRYGVRMWGLLRPPVEGFVRAEPAGGG